MAQLYPRSPDHTEQPAPIRRPGVPSVQRAVRDDLRLREQVGIERYGTPLQPHNGRDALRDLYEELLDACYYAKQDLIERDDRGAEQRIDGDLLADVIANACPLVLTVQASRDVAERALARLAEIDGVTLLRGPNSEPWKPEPVVEAHICCEHAP
jgi:hypothetical protein